jgi:hypothetical protein
VFEVDPVTEVDCVIETVSDKLMEGVSVRVGCTEFETEFDSVIDTLPEPEAVPDFELVRVLDFDLDLERERDLLRVFVGLGPSEPSFVSVFD